jgi:hypothetical protein
VKLSIKPGPDRPGHGAKQPILSPFPGTYGQGARRRVRPPWRVQPLRPGRLVCRLATSSHQPDTTDQCGAASSTLCLCPAGPKRSRLPGTTVAPADRAPANYWHATRAVEGGLRAAARSAPQCGPSLARRSCGSARVAAPANRALPDRTTPVVAHVRARALAVPCGPDGRHRPGHGDRRRPGTAPAHGQARSPGPMGRDRHSTRYHSRGSRARVGRAALVLLHACRVSGIQLRRLKRRTWCVRLGLGAVHHPRLPRLALAGEGGAGGPEPTAVRRDWPCLRPESRHTPARHCSTSQRSRRPGPW